MRTKLFISCLLFLIFFTRDVGATGNLSNVEAMFIYNFLRHVNWPENSGGESFIIGVYGNSETYNQLVEYTANRKVGAKSIQVHKIASADEIVSCQLIFVPASNFSKISSIINQVGNRPCLIVSEKEGSNAYGSTIEFVFKDNTLKFRVNEERAKEQNLLVSRALLDMSI